jgi:endonuclease/exonuclease/phosphatase family metal-dependent hydrolase
MKFKIINLNIEGDIHVDKVISFFKNEDPDILLMQEVNLLDVKQLSLETGLQYANYIPMGINVSGKNSVQGCLILSKYIFIDSGYYTLYEMKEGDQDFYGQFTKNFHMLYIKLLINEELITFYTTHLPWAPNGDSSKIQNVCVDSIIYLLKDKNKFILTGDFNSPRGRGNFSRLSNSMKDNIPSDVNTTLDLNLHRAAPLYLVVDGLFTSHDIGDFQSVKVMDGVSDHMAIVAEIDL